MNDCFCVMPFYSMNFNYSQPPVACCLMEPGHNINDVRNDILAGHRPSACKKCWELEDIGVTSDRQLKNAAFDFYKDQDIRNIEADCQRSQYSTQIVQITTSNLCNSQCVVCGPQFSTSWATLKQLPIKLHQLPDSEIEKIDLRNIKMLTFVGGEPLYDKRNLEILKKMQLLGNRDCFITVVTNGSIMPSAEYTSVLSQFTNLNFCLSIDGIGKTFEYLRYPLQWDQLLTNIDRYRSIGIKLSVSFTISNLNILYYHDTVQWFKDHNLNYNHNMVSSPEYFSVNALPFEIKQSRPDLADFFAPHSNKNDEDFQKFCQEVQKQDLAKKITISDFMPEVAQIISEYQKLR